MNRAKIVISRHASTRRDKETRKKEKARLRTERDMEQVRLQ
jgi:hypothetical protein